MNRGYLTVFLSSIKVIMEQLDSIKETIDKNVYSKSMGELYAMKKTIESILKENHKT